MLQRVTSLCFLVGILYSFQVNSQTNAPNEFLPHKIGEAFTPHHLLVDYMYHVAENNSNVLIQEYGKTNQKRPLLHLTISSQENIDNIDKIRLNNLYRAGLEEGQSYPEFDDIAIVWLSFSVHGNEASGSESSMPVLYELVKGEQSEIKSWLENTVVLFDPSINPDGYSRYTNWQRDRAQKALAPNTDDREHYEPWPGGRVNHYLFDLNRDWAWQTQVESRQRMKIFNQWLPHVHVDFHEMGYNSPYYFAPAARPYHDYITDWQSEFQFLIGRNNAKYFDKEGWLYFTREVFDLFYPSYGDTYPTFNGAIGMTYEQGGHSRAGRAINMENGDVLTLSDRVKHHFTTALSTIETTSVNAEKLINEFKTFYSKPAPGKYKSYVVKRSEEHKLKDLKALLDLQDIDYETVGQKIEAKGYSYFDRREEEYTLEDGDLYIPVDQPKKVLLQVLMDPDAVLEDSLTYDITAWALPYAYGLEAYASTSTFEVGGWSAYPPETNNVPENAYACIIEWNSLHTAALIAKLNKQEVRMRLTAKPFDIGGREFGRNSIVITRADNKSMGDELFENLFEAGLGEVDYAFVSTGFSGEGADLGSGSVELLRTPNVLIVSGESVSTNSFGQVWYYFEQVVDYPITIVEDERLMRIDLDQYNVLVLTDGFYSFSENDLKKLSDWVRGGGKLINVGYANNNFAGKDGWALEKYATDEEESEAKKLAEEEKLTDRFHAYEGSERRRIVNNVPGAIFEVKMDETHPLAYGIGDRYYSLKTGGLNFRPLKGAYNIGLIQEDAQVIGFTGSKIKEELKGSVNFAVESKGRGSVVYLIDNPLYRGFWKEGLLLFSNAVFLVE